MLALEGGDVASLEMDLASKMNKARIASHAVVVTRTQWKSSTCSASS